MARRSMVMAGAWAALVLVIGCGGGGSNNSGPPSEAATVARFVGQWSGTMRVQGGVDQAIDLTILASGAVSGGGAPLNAPYPYGPIYTYSGVIQGSGSFTLAGTSPGLPNTTINGSLAQTGNPADVEGTVTSGFLASFLNGNGSMSSGSAPMGVTLSLQEEG